MKRRKSYKYIYGILVVFIGIGFAYLTANLNINGIGSFGSQSWDIHFDNVVVDNTSYNPVTPTVSNDDLTITFASGLRLPGDYYKFNVDIVNDGTLDAMFDSVNVTANNDFSNYIDYTITYQSGDPLTQYDALPTNSSSTVTVNFFVKDIDLEDLPSENVELSFTLTFNYIMADERATLKKYVVSDIEMNIGNPIPNGVNLRDTPELAMADWQSLTNVSGDTRPFFLKHIIVNGLISESYLGFVVTENMATSNSGMQAGTYLLRGGVDESSDSTKPIYESNKSILLNAFGSSHCNDSGNTLYCYVSGFGVDAYNNGNVDSYDISDHGCVINNSGESYATN